MSNKYASSVNFKNKLAAKKHQLITNAKSKFKNYVNKNKTKLKKSIKKFMSKSNKNLVFFLKL